MTARVVEMYGYRFVPVDEGSVVYVASSPDAPAEEWVIEDENWVKSGDYVFATQDFIDSMERDWKRKVC